MSHPAPRAHSPSSSGPDTSEPSYLDTKITLETYRTLLGLPQPRPASASASLSSRLPRWWPSSQRHRRRRGQEEHHDEESPLIRDEAESVTSEHREEAPQKHHTLTKPTGLYSTLLTHLHRTTLILTLHTTLLYLGPLVQLLLSALIILLASQSSEHRIALAVFGALNGLVAGGVAMVVGRSSRREGLRRFREGLENVRERVEWVERELEVGLREVVYREVVGLRGEVEDLVASRGRR